MIKYVFLCLWSILSWGNPHIEQGKNYFFSYCSGCHSLQYGPASSIHRTNLVAADAEKWFGRTPPDLSLITLKYSKKWLVQYLVGFYPEPKGRFGVNNYIYPNVMMPNVLASSNHLGLPNKDDKINLEKIASDIADYLDDIAQPERDTRYFWGTIVLFFCIIGVVIAAILNKFYKK
jgi:ubiquinol-cytochrome c reductase cytochrome c1 subunit